MIHPFRRLRGTVIRVVVLALVAALAIPINATVATAHPGHGAETFNALVFSKTAGFRHDSIPAGIAAIKELGTQNGFEVTATEDATMFNDTELAKYEVVIWLSTTGDVLDADQQAAFERYINKDYEGGRAWYTGMGHTIESFTDPVFRSSPPVPEPALGSGAGAPSVPLRSRIRFEAESV
jgi:hypothetical protein